MPTALGLTTEPRQQQQQASPSTQHGSNNRTNNTISKRNYAAAIEMETLLWRALCDRPAAAKEYLAPECVMINPFLAGSDQPLGPTSASASDPNSGIAAALDRVGRPWCGYRFVEEPLVAEVDLMAVSLVYRITLFQVEEKEGGGGGRTFREVRAVGCSSWRQTAGADWVLCAHSVMPAPGGG